MHPAVAITGDTEHDRTSHVAWLSWAPGGAVLVAVVAAALHFSEESAFVLVAQEAKPWWLAVAVLLQPFAVVADIIDWSAATAARMANQYGHIGDSVRRQAMAALDHASVWSNPHHGTSETGSPAALVPEGPRARRGATGCCRSPPSSAHARRAGSG